MLGSSGILQMKRQVRHFGAEEYANRYCREQSAYLAADELPFSS
jgi:hypothetical protein